MFSSLSFCFFVFSFMLVLLYGLTHLLCLTFACFSLTLSHFTSTCTIPSHESQRSCICVLEVSNLPLYLRCIDWTLELFPQCVIYFLSFLSERVLNYLAFHLLPMNVSSECSVTYERIY